MLNRGERLARVVCPRCGREVSARTPKDGDGSAVMPVAHRFEGVPCEGRYDLVEETISDGSDYRGAIRDGYRGGSW